MPKQLKKRHRSSRSSASFIRRQDLRSALRIDALTREVEAGLLPPSVRNHCFSKIARSRDIYRLGDLCYEEILGKDFHLRNESLNLTTDSVDNVPLNLTIDNVCSLNLTMGSDNHVCLRGHTHVDREDVDECYRNFFRVYGHNVEKFMEIFKCNKQVAEDMFIRYGKNYV
ncbi:unnamed protein product [Rhizophagus irregularis]|nr:unnamed protein product [Rhizophagus irregularis]CAB4413918.1 unnamed protein product [Rhizophagus irregularis]